MIRKLSFYVLSVLILIVGCTPENGDAELQDELKIGGSTTVSSAAVPASEAFMELYPNINVTVRPVGSGAGVEGAGTGAFHIGMASRTIKDSELETWPTLQATLVGRDAVAIVVNRALFDAGITQLSVSDIRDIYLGEITNWQDLGGPDQEIRAFDKELEFGTREIFGNFFLGDEEAPAPGSAGNLGTRDSVINTVAQFENAISYGSITWQTEDVINIAIILEDGSVVEPTLENVISGAYPVVRDLNLITDGDPTGNAITFIDFMLSPEGQAFIIEAGYVPIIES